MKIDKAHPLYETLYPCRAWVHYEDWRDIKAGHYQPVAARLLRRGQRFLYFSVALDGGVALRGLYLLGEYWWKGGTENLVWGLVYCGLLAWIVPTNLRLYRALISAASLESSLPFASANADSTSVAVAASTLSRCSDNVFSVE